MSYKSGGKNNISVKQALQKRYYHSCLQVRAIRNVSNKMNLKKKIIK